MCNLCEENGGEYTGCQDCGRAICFDHRGDGDYPSQAYVTMSGDLFCIRCGAEYDRIDEDGHFCWDYYPADWYDPTSPVSEIEPAETPRYKYIGEGSETEDTSS